MWLQQVQTPDSPVPPVVRAPIPVDNTNRPGSAAFDRTSPDAPAGGGYLRDNCSGHKFHITGTNSDGKYIPSHVIDRDGNVVIDATEPPSFAIKDEVQLLEMFDLVELEGDPGHFRRPGFIGKYSLGKDRDGTCTLFFSGGQHASGIVLEPQTFHHGHWDRTRVEEPAKPPTVSPQQKPFLLPPLIDMSPEQPPRDERDRPTTPPPPPVPMTTPMPDAPKQSANPPPGNGQSPASPPVLKWDKVAGMVAAAALGKDNGIPGSERHPGFAAVLYERGVFTNFHKHYPDANPNRTIAYDKVATGIQAGKTYTLKPVSSGDAEYFRGHSGSENALVTTVENSPVYLFQTESKLDGFGMIVLSGEKGALPDPVAKAYERASTLGRAGEIVTNRWMLMDDKSKLHAMVRRNGQVLFCSAGKSEADLFDPLQSILLNAELTQTQAKNKEPSWSTLKDLMSEKGGGKYRKVKWDGAGVWRYTTTGVPTIPPRSGEPAPPTD